MKFPFNYCKYCSKDDKCMDRINIGTLEKYRVYLSDKIFCLGFEKKFIYFWRTVNREKVVKK